MKIEFRKQNIPFTQVANGVLNDKTLTAGAKGLYAYLYSKPDGWNFASLRIAGDMNCGQRAILTLINELKEHGYLITQRLTDGRMIYEVQYPPIKPDVENSNVVEKPHVEKRSVQKRHIAETATVSNKEYISNKEEESNTNSESIPILIKSFEKINPACKKMYGNNTQRSACESLIEEYTLERVLNVIENTLPKTNKIEYLPTITSPVQLYEKWSSLEAGIMKLKNKSQTNNVVAFK